jgi:hypothetical protein
MGLELGPLSLGRYSSLAYTGHGVYCLFCLYVTLCISDLILRPLENPKEDIWNAVSKLRARSNTEEAMLNC